MEQDLKDFLQHQFTEVGRQFAELRQEVTDLRRNMDQQVTDLRRSMDQQVTDLRRDLDRQIIEVREGVHQTGILVEGIDAKIDLVAEGVRTNTEVMHRLHGESRQELYEFRVVMEASHRHLEVRVSDHDGELAKV